MNHRMRRIVETQACERRYGIADAKGAEYSGKGSTYKETGADTLANFKNVSERIGGTPEQVLMTYLLKHIDSINTAVREAAQATDPGLNVYPKGEGIVSRLDDARNYLDLLECLLIDRGLIEPVRDAEGELYAEIGMGAAELTFPERQPGQYPGPHPSRFANPNDLDLTDPVAVANAVADDSRWAPVEAHVEAQEILQREMLEAEGLVECLDGVWRPAANKDASVRNPGEKQTPIYARPAVFNPPSLEGKGILAEPTMDAVRYGETGELA